MTAKDYATIQRMLGQIEGAAAVSDDCFLIEVVGSAVQVIDEALDRADEMERCRRAEP